MSRYNQKYDVNLKADEQIKVDRAIRSTTTSRTIKCRAQILKLANAHKLTQKQIAMQVGVSPSTVNLAIKQYTTEGIDSVLQFKHNSDSDDAKRKVDSRAEAKMVALACSPPPNGYSRWTHELLAKHSKRAIGEQISASTVGKILKRNKLQPHRSKY